MDRDREIRRALTAFVTFLAMLVLIVAVTLIVTGCAASGQAEELVVDENPPAPLQTRTYDMEMDKHPWRATKVYDATSGRSWWLLRRENTHDYVVLEGGGNVPVG